MKIKNLTMLVLSVALLAVLAMNVVATNQNVIVDYIEVNGDELELSNGYEINYAFERGEDIDIKVRIKALEDAEDVQIDADIKGYEYASYETDLISDSTSTFDLDENDTLSKNLRLQIPVKADKDYYKLRIRVADRFGDSDEYTYSLHVKGVDRSEAIEIKAYSFSPSNTIYAGRSLLANVKLKNYGDRDLDDITVTVSIPELNVRDTATLDELDADESETVEELLLRVPMNAKPGDYQIEIMVDYDEYESSTVTDIITVECYEGGDVCGATSSNKPDEATIVNVPSSTEMTETGAVFPITIKNNGVKDTVYSLSVSGINWGEFRFDPAADFIVESGMSKTVYLYLTADKVDAGEKFFKLQVKAGNEINEVALSVDVAETKSTGLRNALEIGLIILVVILIIIGLIIGFSKLRDNKSDDEAEAYY